MEGTAALQHQSAAAGRPPAEPVVHKATALAPAVHRRDPSPASVPRLGGSRRFPGPLLAAGLLGWHEALHVGQRAGQQAQSLHHPTPGRPGGGGRVGHGLSRDAAAGGVTDNWSV
jgi:hypothetical protein